MRHSARTLWYVLEIERWSHQRDRGSTAAVDFDEGIALLNHEAEGVPVRDHGVSVSGPPLLISTAVLLNHLIGSRHRPPVISAGAEIRLPRARHVRRHISSGDFGVVKSKSFEIERGIDDGSSGNAPGFDAGEEGRTDASLKSGAIHAIGSNSRSRHGHTSPIVCEVVGVPSRH